MKKWIFCFMMTLVSAWSFSINAMDTDADDGIRRVHSTTTAEVFSSRKLIKSEWGKQDIGFITGKKKEYIACVSLLLAKNTVSDKLEHAAVIFEGYGEMPESLSHVSATSKGKYKEYTFQNEEGGIWAVGFDLRPDGVHVWDYKSIEDRFLPDYKTAEGVALTYTVSHNVQILMRHAENAIIDALEDSSSEKIGCGCSQIKYCLCGGCCFQKFCCGPKLYNCASYAVRVLKSANIYVPLCVNRVCCNLLCDCGLRSCIFGSLESLQEKISKMRYTGLNKLNKKLGLPALSTRERVANSLTCCW